MARFSAEWCAYWAGVWAVALTVAAAIAGLLVWWFSNAAADAHEARTRALELSVSRQQERAAKAESDLIDLKKRTEQRGVHLADLQAALRDKPSGNIVIMTQPDDPEATALASVLNWAFHKTDWHMVSLPQQIPRNFVSGALALEPSARQRPATVRAGGGLGVYVVADSFNNELGTTMYEALVKIGLARGMSVDPKLPKDTLRIVVGPKP